MPYFISDEQDDCAGWATIKIDDDGAVETIGCHETMNEAVAQMVAVSLDEGMEPGGMYDRSEQRNDVTSFQQSQWRMFDREFAEMVKNDHPNIWDAGGNIRGDDQYEILTRIAEQGGVAETDDQVAALQLREAWVARHRQNFRLAGVVAQMKWLAVGSRGEDYMKNLIRDEIEKDATRDGEPVTMKRGQLSNVREVRQYGISNVEVREAGDGQPVTFAGYASVFNHDYEVYDAFGAFTERLAPGAFTRTLTEDPDVMLLVNHQGLPLARTKSGTLRLTQDNIGLRVEAQLDPSDPDVQAVLPKMRRGDVDEMSFAFRVNEQAWSEDYSDRTITEVNLARGDVSIVSYGANPATVAALRAALADDDVRAQLLREIKGDVEELGTEERVLTTDDLNEPADAEPVDEPAEEQPVEDEERGLHESVPSMTYHLSQLVDRRQSV